MTTNNPEAKRYDMSACHEHICRVFDMQESEDGDYVEWEAYEALQAELADMERGYLTIIEAQDAEHRKQLARLQAECEKLRKDADRYRWLMERGDDFQWENIIRLDIEDFPSRCAAIDAAMEPPK